jgi:tetratricopeptide (TPR) repeat protein
LSFYNESYVRCDERLKNRGERDFCDFASSEKSYKYYILGPHRSSFNKTLNDMEMTYIQRKSYCLKFLHFFLVGFLWVASSHLVEAQSPLIDSLQQAYEAATNDSTRLARLNSLSYHSLRVDIDEAERLAHLMLSYGDSVGIHAQDAAALDYLGIAAYLRGEYEKAMDYYEKALDRAYALNDSVIIAGAINNMGIVYLRLGRYEKAFEYIQEGSQIVEAIGFDRDYTASLCNLGSILQEMGEYEQAARYFEQCVAKGKAVGFVSLYATGYLKLGMVAEKQRQSAPARTYYEKALMGFEEAGDRYGKSNALIRLGLIYANDGAFAKAQQALDSAYALSQAYQYEEG